jgi:aerobic-type carbon monoxide dehydrogenase small subunit (CoxS/CutS family)
MLLGSALLTHSTRAKGMIKLEINGQMRTFDVTDDVPLLWALRDVPHMTGTKFACGMALCDPCTVQVDGVATRHPKVLRLEPRSRWRRSHYVP